ncbi:MAG: septal ring lytic transglycosylase RlpA family protein [Saprospiraceae bacterium]|nr:septal ring lytic transglycosylase RlpA family protein [Saprospiraceae bacterium]
MASYYADKFEGQKTANGELYDHEKLTAAHRTIPFGTVLRVTNMRTQNSVIVRVNDRGPFNKRFVIDLSKEAAKAIDIHDGSQDVKIEILENTVIGEVSIHDIGKPKDTIAENKIVPVVIEEKKSEAIEPQKQKTADSESKEVALLKNIYKIESVELPENQFVIKVGKVRKF